MFFCVWNSFPSSLRFSVDFSWSCWCQFIVWRLVGSSVLEGAMSLDEVGHRGQDLRSTAWTHYLSALLPGCNVISCLPFLLPYLLCHDRLYPLKQEASVMPSSLGLILDRYLTIVGTWTNQSQTRCRNTCKGDFEAFGMTTICWWMRIFPQDWKQVDWTIPEVNCGMFSVLSTTEQLCHNKMRHWLK